MCSIGTGMVVFIYKNIFCKEMFGLSKIRKYTAHLVPPLLSIRVATVSECANSVRLTDRVGI